MTLRPLKIGQIWQCQDQSKHVKIVRNAGFEYPNSVIGAQFMANTQPPPNTDSGNYYLIHEKHGMYIRTLNPVKGDPTNLVVLLYDPSDG